MNSRKLIFPQFLVMLTLLILAVVPQSRAQAQICYDDKKIKIQCPEKEKKPTKIPPRPTKTNTPTPTSTATQTSTVTPKPTDTPIPTSTPTKPAAPAGGLFDPSNLDLISVHNLSPLIPWLMTGAGILILLLFAAVLRPVIIGRIKVPSTLRSNRTPAGGAENQDIGDNESTSFVKITDTSITRINPRSSNAHQVTEVHVKAYDPVHQKEIVGSSSSESNLGDMAKAPTHHKDSGHSKTDHEDQIAPVDVEMYVENIHSKFA